MENVYVDVFTDVLCFTVPPQFNASNSDLNEERVLDAARQLTPQQREGVTS
jgi:hypothetical protein